MPDEDLQQLRADERRHARLSRDLDDVERRSRIAERRLERLAAQIGKEGRDVRKLTGLTLSSIYLHLFGDHGEELRREERELLAAQVRHDEQLAELTALEADAARIRAELDAFGDLAGRRRDLLAELAERLRAAGGAAGAELDGLDAERAERTADLRELDEALAAGRSAVRALDGAVEDLGQARHLGALDMMGGGAITTMIKHSRLDDAHRSIGAAQRHLRRFARELRDVRRVRADFDLGIGPGERFVDTFFDNLITDWIVQSKIVESAARARETRIEVRELVHELGRRRDAVRSRLEQVEAERLRAIESGG